jgi:hypothetical protein
MKSVISAIILLIFTGYGHGHAAVWQITTLSKGMLQKSGSYPELNGVVSCCLLSVFIFYDQDNDNMFRDNELMFSSFNYRTKNDDRYYFDDAYRGEFIEYTIINPFPEATPPNDLNIATENLIRDEFLDQSWGIESSISLDKNGYFFKPSGSLFVDVSGGREGYLNLHDKTVDIADEDDVWASGSIHKLHLRNLETGESRLFVVTPVPLPAPVWMTAFGALALWRVAAPACPPVRRAGRSS